MTVKRRKFIKQVPSLNGDGECIIRSSWYEWRKRTTKSALIDLTSSLLLMIAKAAIKARRERLPLVVIVEGPVTRSLNVKSLVTVKNLSRNIERLY
jgi:hypothetical protein